MLATLRVSSFSNVATELATRKRNMEAAGGRAVDRSTARPPEGAHATGRPCAVYFVPYTRRLDLLYA
jgi:hypothetical protein